MKAAGLTAVCNPSIGQCFVYDIVLVACDGKTVIRRNMPDKNIFAFRDGASIL